MNRVILTNLIKSIKCNFTKNYFYGIKIMLSGNKNQILEISL